MERPLTRTTGFYLVKLRDVSSKFLPVVEADTLIAVEPEEEGPVGPQRGMLPALLEF
jgi:hypothetical protein